MIPVHSRPAYINQIQRRLNVDALPGVEAHLRMAHAVKKAKPFPGNSSVRDAAVLMVIFEKIPGSFQMIFIRRTSKHQGDKHSGQIAFPGGKVEKEDRDFMYTALRETNEEIGIDLAQVDILGQLTPIYINVSGFMVHPFVAYAWQMPVYLKQDEEIEEILEFPIDLFKDLSIRQERTIHIGNGITLNHVPSFNVDGHVIWGATAMIMNEFLEVIHDL